MIVGPLDPIDIDTLLLLAVRCAFETQQLIESQVQLAEAMHADRADGRQPDPEIGGLLVRHRLNVVISRTEALAVKAGALADEAAKARRRPELTAWDQVRAAHVAVTAGHGAHVAARVAAECRDLSGYRILKQNLCL